MAYSSWAFTTANDDVGPMLFLVLLIEQFFARFLLDFLEKVEIPVSSLRIDRMGKSNVLSEKSVDAGSHTIAIDSLVMIRQDLLIESFHPSCILA